MVQVLNLSASIILPSTFLCEQFMQNTLWYFLFYSSAKYEQLQFTPPCFLVKIFTMCRSMSYAETYWCISSELRLQRVLIFDSREINKTESLWRCITWIPKFSYGSVKHRPIAIASYLYTESTLCISKPSYVFLWS